MPRKNIREWFAQLSSEQRRELARKSHLSRMTRASLPCGCHGRLYVDKKGVSRFELTRCEEHEPKSRS